MIRQQTIGKRIEILIQVFVVLTQKINVILVFVKKVLPIVTTIINMVATVLIQWRVIIHELKIKKNKQIFHFFKKWNIYHFQKFHFFKKWNFYKSQFPPNLLILNTLDIRLIPLWFPQKGKIFVYYLCGFHRRLKPSSIHSVASTAPLNIRSLSLWFPQKTKTFIYYFCDFHSASQYSFITSVTSTEG